MGNYIRSLSECVNLIASDNTWIEGKAIQQLQTTEKLQGMQHICAMPDLHPGRGYPVGAAFFTTDYIYPALVGNDIGCGMSLWQTGLNAAKVHLDKLERLIGNLDNPEDSDWLEEYIPANFNNTPYDFALGTIGGGNHFAELQQIDKIYHHEQAEQLELNKKQLLLLVHSGSRGFGQSILKKHMTDFGYNGLAAKSEHARHYMALHDQAINYAKLNRSLIATRILERLRCDGQNVSDSSHNLVSPITINGKAGFLHRKGAAPATEGAVIIPGSRGDYSYLVNPLLANASLVETSLFSLAHGAGRKWGRGDCKGRLKQNFTFEQLGRTQFNSRVICHDRELIYEEAPQAYKNIDSVIDVMVQAGLIEVIARLKPVLTYKTTGEKE